MNRIRKTAITLQSQRLALVGVLALAAMGSGIAFGNEIAAETASSALATSSITPTNLVNARQDTNDKSDLSPDRMALDRNSDGGVLRSMTIEGDDQVSVRFERPGILLDLQPRTAPGLGWRNTWEKVELFPVVTSFSALEPSPYLGSPWLDSFSAEEVVVFRPMAEQSHRWMLTVVDSRGRPAVSFEGKGQPPESIAWDGRRTDGSPAWPGLIYTHVLETRDKAGNLRTYTGEGFELPPYRLTRKDGIQLVMAGELFNGATGVRRAETGPAPDLIREAASWLNQVEGIEREIEIMVTARSKGQARRLAEAVARSLNQKIIGNPSRLGTSVQVVTDAPDHGMVIIATR